MVWKVAYTVDNPKFKMVVANIYKLKGSAWKEEVTCEYRYENILMFHHKHKKPLQWEIRQSFTCSRVYSRIHLAYWCKITHRVVNVLQSHIKPVEPRSGSSPVCVIRLLVYSTGVFYHLPRDRQFAEQKENFLEDRMFTGVNGLCCDYTSAQKVQLLHLLKALNFPKALILHFSHTIRPSQCSLNTPQTLFLPCVLCLSQLLFSRLHAQRLYTLLFLPITTCFSYIATVLRVVSFSLTSCDC